MWASQIDRVLNLQHAECVAEAAKAVFGMTCGVEIRPAPAEGEKCSDGVILSLISLLGDIDWSVFLGLPRRTATAAATRFAGFDIPFESDDMGDAVGELTNILAGQVKALLDRRGVRAELSLPSVVRAESLAMLSRRGLQIAKICFSSELGKLWTGVTSGRPSGLVI